MGTNWASFFGLEFRETTSSQLRRIEKLASRRLSSNSVKMPLTVSVRYALPLVATILTAVATAGCGSSKISPEAVAEAAQATIEAGGSRVALTETVEVPGEGKVATV